MKTRAAIPTEVRFNVLKRADKCCEDCGDRTRLELHHLRYWVGISRRSIFGIETESDLAALCRRCHRRRHIDPVGEYWRDPEEMATHWASFYSEMEKP